MKIVSATSNNPDRRHTPTTVPAFQSPDEKALEEFIREKKLKINPLRPTPLPVVRKPNDNE